jgi:hypothetical protein
MREVLRRAATRLRPVPLRRAAGAPLAAAGALLLAGCGHAAHPAASGSTLEATWSDPDGNGVLAPGPGEPLRTRTDLGPAAPATRTLFRFAQITDVHIRDEESPARVAFLDRFGGSFSSTFRPQEALTGQVLADTLRAVDAAHPQAVVETGDLIDNDQANELDEALAVLRGGRVDPNSGAPGYDGVQETSDPDPFYYRPGVDPPRHPGLLTAAERPFTSPGLRAPWYPVLGNHDVLVQGILGRDASTEAAAVGDRALWEPPRGLDLPHTQAAVTPAAAAALLARANVHVAADPRRRELTAAETIARLIRASGHGATSGGYLDYTFDLGSDIRAVALDLIRRQRGSSGIVRPAQLAFLRSALATAGRRWVVVFTPSQLERVQNGAAALALLDRDPRVLATIAGDTHANRVAPRHTPAGGFWEITTSSLIDYPQQARAFTIRATRGGGAEIDTWMLDHPASTGLAAISRQLAYLDAQGGRPAHEIGGRLDRNVRLYKPPVGSG